MTNTVSKVLLIGGTEDGRNIALKLIEKEIDFLATVTTDYGEELMLGTGDNIKVLKAKLTMEQMVDLIKKEKVQAIVDGSHPYAYEVSKNAMQAAHTADVPYFRYERKQTEYSDENVTVVDDFYQAAELCNQLEGNIFLTIGSNHLLKFCEIVDDYKNRLYARILPVAKMVERAENAGMNAGHIIAVQGPFSKEFNLQTIKHVDGKIFVTKDSGSTGGTAEKIAAAKELGCQIIIVKREGLEYDVVFDQIDELIAAL